MAADFDPQGIPPQWVLDRTADECGYGPQDVIRNPTRWTVGSPSFRALALYIWKHEEPPVDPDLQAMREALAAAYDVCGEDNAAAKYRAGKYDPEVTAALAAFRKAQAS